MRQVYVSLALAVGALAQLMLSAGAAAAEAAGLDSKPVCERRAELAGEKPVEIKPAEAKPVEAKPAEAKSAEEVAVVPDAKPRPVPTPLDLSTVELADEETYSDVIRILKEENSCSRFFGGPAKAVEVFNHFSRELRRKALGDRATAVRMSGSYTRYRNQTSGVTYRLFDEATLNINNVLTGRFNSPGPSRLMVGRFPLQSRQARALVMLHELGHLVEGEDGEWLLENDGGNPALSDRNTKAVERRCVKQLTALGG